MGWAETSGIDGVRRADPPLALAAAILGSMLAAIATTCALFALGIALSPIAAIAVLALSAAVLAATAAWLTGRWWAALPVFAALAVAFAVAGRLIDTSFDGMEYHFDATYALMHGWNPLHARYGQVLAPGAPALPWPAHFPIGSWVLMALLGLAGLSAEASKGVLVLPALAAMLAWASALRTAGMRRDGAAALAVLAAASPVFLAQAPTRLTDGVIAGLASTFCACTLAYSLRRDPLALATACCALALAIAIKFNALAIFGMLSAVLCVALLLRVGPGAAVRAGIALAGTAALAVLTIGFHPYVTNTVAHGTPFYPVLGAPEYEINSALLPAGLAGHAPVVQLALSVLSPSDAPAARIKPPFRIARAEIAAAGQPGLILGGFGPWFSGALLLTALAGIASIGGSSAASRTLLALAAAALVSALVTPYGWWPRYIPQLWMAALLAGMAGVLSGRRPAEWLGIAGSVALAINSLIVAGSALLLARQQTWDVRRDIAEARAAGGELCGAFGAAHSLIAVMQRAGVRVIPIATRLPLRCPGGRPLRQAWDVVGEQGVACPCGAVPHATDGRWHPLPDRTAQDILLLKRSAR